MEFWYKKSVLAYLLQPAALIYRAIVGLRKKAYLKGWLASKKISVPVIIVGNLTVGGTGKTPLVIWLAEFLQQQGFKPGIISRGYGGKGPFPQLVLPHSNPNLVGDEPVLIAKKALVPMVVAPDRVAAAEHLLRNFSACDIIISDDGLQHYALQRDLEIVVIDGQRRFGNELCLPAGPLREPLSRLKEVDFMICNGIARPGEYGFDLKQGTAYHLENPEYLKPITEFKTVHAIAGIGNPPRFFEALRAQGVQVIEHAFSDHYHFTKEDILFSDDLPVLMTEKDGVKCQAFADSRHWCVPVSLVMEAKFIEVLQQKLLLCHAGI